MRAVTDGNVGFSQRAIAQSLAWSMLWRSPSTYVPTPTAMILEISS
ncbi:hypothetical protein P7L53_04890 [Thermoleptolyngbya sichuanensis XZ-Cy5]|nr:hypothetical protein [Thermoleptolyngbya sichuanensis]MDG2615574.1 hypothetical protein [Thermoleptolyngbya sichuanensis XZ-Cy5]